MAKALKVDGHQHEDAWDRGWLRVDDVHEIYYQQYGKKDGKPGQSGDSFSFFFLSDFTLRLIFT